MENGRPEGDVRRGVLVEERAPEGQPAPADTRRLVDERDLAEVGRAVVQRHLRPDLVLAGRRLHLRDPAAGEGHLEVAHDRPADQDERLRRADMPLGPAPVRRREHLLGRQVRDVELPRRRLLAAPPSSATEAAARRSGRCPGRGTGPRRSLRSFSCAARLLSIATCSFQAATGSGSSRRTVARIASQRRATSGSPNTCSAQPGVGKATIVHGISPRSMAFQIAPASLRHDRPRDALRRRDRRRGRDRARRRRSTNAVPRSASSSTRWSIHGGAQPTASSAASSARARRT